MSLILCIETGTDICSVGIAREGEIVSLRESDEGLSLIHISEPTRR